MSTRALQKIGAIATEAVRVGRDRTNAGEEDRNRTSVFVQHLTHF